MALVELRGVRKDYGTGAGLVTALHELDLDIEPGEFTVFSGPSGSGKTTLFNIVGCLDEPSAGTLRIEGAEIASKSANEIAEVRARRIGFVFQSFNLIPVLTTVENVELALQLAGETSGLRERSVAALGEVGLANFLDRYPNQLSGGQQQRVAIARALVKRPALVLADEPTANLDSTNGAAVLDLMRDLNHKQGITFLCATHDPMVLERARRVVRLRDGRVVGDERRGEG
jgi:putative ABC transport system ATP-binding protein